LKRENFLPENLRFQLWSSWMSCSDELCLLISVSVQQQKPSAQVVLGWTFLFSTPLYFNFSSHNKARDVSM